MNEALPYNQFKCTTSVNEISAFLGGIFGMLGGIMHGSISSTLSGLVLGVLLGLAVGIGFLRWMIHRMERYPSRTKFVRAANLWGLLAGLICSCLLHLILFCIFPKEDIFVLGYTSMTGAYFAIPIGVFLGGYAGRKLWFEYSVLFQVTKTDSIPDEEKQQSPPSTL